MWTVAKSDNPHRPCLESPLPGRARGRKGASASPRGTKLTSRSQSCDNYDARIESERACEEYEQVELGIGISHTGFPGELRFRNSKRRKTASCKKLTHRV